MPRKNATQPPKRTELKPLRSADVDLDLSEPVPTIQPPSSSSPPPSPLSIRASRNVARTHHWKNNAYAAGLVEPTWSDEVARTYVFDDDEESSGINNANGPNRTCCEDAASENMDPTCGCLFVSGVVCGRLGFKRLGNMVILKERIVNVEGDDSFHSDMEMDADGMGRRQETEIVYIIGPYWPMLFFITYPLIIGVSIFTATRVVFVEGAINPLLAWVWTALTSGLCYSLFSVSFKNPGILKKHATPPDGPSSSMWRWDDRVQSYVPRRAFYDPDCAVMVEDFDHTCPWTGTAIGRGNMAAFQAFVSLVFICLIMDIILLTTTAVI